MRTWLVTGCSSGFGRAIAEEALRRGDRVVATARNPQQVEHFTSRHTGQAINPRLDVTNQKSIEDAVDAAVAWAGGIDILVNNAGFGMHGAIEEVAHEEAVQVFDANVFGLLRVTRAVLPHMRAQGRGHVINIGSVAGLVASEGAGIYAATKFAVEGISEALRAEVEPLGIRVTVVEPGPFRTEFSGGSLRKAAATIAAYAETAGRRSRQLRANSGRQPGDPERAARVICDVAGSPTSPFRLVLGATALDRARAKLSAALDEIAAWDSVGRATDFSTS